VSEERSQSGRYWRGLILVVWGLAMAWLVPQVGNALCGDAWSSWMSIGWTILGIGSAGFGAWKAWDAASILAGKKSLAERWGKWSTRNLTRADRGN
jgi:hypothetical protein